MNKAGYTVLSLLMLLFIMGQNTPAQKDSAGVKAPAASVAASSDEELILDEPVPPPPTTGEKKAATTAAKDSAPAATKTDANPVVQPAGAKAIPQTAVKPGVDSGAANKLAAPPAPVVAATDSAAQKKVARQPTATEKTAARTRDSASAIVDEELILDGGEEDLLGHVKPAVPAAASTKKDSLHADSAGAAAALDSSASPVADSGAGPVVATPIAGENAAATTLPKPGALASATKIEKIRSINFAANLKEYRSPKLAMLMSLIIPGSGQVYARSNWVAAAFLAVEAAVFGTGYAFIARSKSQKKDARAFADKRYSQSQFEQYYTDFKNYLEKELGSADKANSVIIDSLFFGDSTGAQTLLDNLKQKNDLYYDDLYNEASLLVRGWKDVTPDFSAEDGFEGIDTLLFRTEGGTAPYLVAHRGKNDIAFGFSKDQLTYIDMINQSRSLARTGKSFYMSLLVNHIASAVIAGILAKKHNDALLGEESVWQRIDVEQQQVNTGSHTVTGYALGIRF